MSNDLICVMAADGDIDAKKERLLRFFFFVYVCVCVCVCVCMCLLVVCDGQVNILLCRMI